jgi:hypothetical protein
MGGPLRVSTGDGDLDEFAWVVGVIARFLVASGAPDATFDEQFEIDATPFIVTEAVIERVAKLVDAEVPGAAVISSIEERTMMDLFGHKRLWHWSAIG